MTTKRSLLTIALLCTMAALAAVAQAADKLANVKTIGVISALGDTLYNVQTGVTAFDNDASTTAVADWTLDEFLIAETAALLAGRFAIKPVAYNRADFTPEPSEWRGHSELDVEVKIALARPADGGPIDAYVVVHNIVNGDMFGLTNQRFYAAGLHHRDGMFDVDLDGIFISAMLTLVDARTGKEIDRSVFLIPGGESLFIKVTPAHRVLKDLWGENFAMTPEQREKAHAEFKSLIQEALATSLRRVDMLPKQ